MDRFNDLDVPADARGGACDPARLALVVYDMQVGVVRQLANGGRRWLRRSARCSRSPAARGGVRVVFMRHMSVPNELAGVFGLRMAMAWQRGVTRAEE